MKCCDESESPTKASVRPAAAASSSRVTLCLPAKSNAAASAADLERHALECGFGSLMNGHAGDGYSGYSVVGAAAA